MEIRRRFYYQKNDDGSFALDESGNRIKVYYHPETEAKAVIVDDDGKTLDQALSALGSNEVFLTQAEYDALVESESVDPAKTYYIEEEE